ncbi:MAG: hypothetical protein WD734_06325 [Dehalococcoidia bacterium]
MHRGSVVVALLSFLGGLVAFAIAAALQEPVSLYAVIGVVLLANAGVRYALARRGPVHG